jgi:hypothetical protein
MPSLTVTIAVSMLVTEDKPTYFFCRLWVPPVLSNATNVSAGKLL